MRHDGSKRRWDHPTSRSHVVVERSPGGRASRSGTVTLVFTDIEGSTSLLQALGDRYPEVLADHHRLIRERLRPPRRASSGARPATGSTSSSRLARGPPSRRPSTGSSRSPPMPGPRASRSATGWASTPASRGLRPKATSASTSIARPGSARPATAARSSSRRRPATWSPTSCVRRWACSTWASTGSARWTSAACGSTRSPARAWPATSRRRARPMRPGNNLQLEVTSFIGREREIEQATRILGAVVAADPDRTGRRGQDAGRPAARPDPPRPVRRRGLDRRLRHPHGPRRSCCRSVAGRHRPDRAGRPVAPGHDRRAPQGQAPPARARRLRPGPGRVRRARRGARARLFGRPGRRHQPRGARRSRRGDPADRVPDDA